MSQQQNISNAKRPGFKTPQAAKGAKLHEYEYVPNALDYGEILTVYNK
jgi:hypothetical protein